MLFILILFPFHPTRCYSLAFITLIQADRPTGPHVGPAVNVGPAPGAQPAPHSLARTAPPVLPVGCASMGGGRVAVAPSVSQEMFVAGVGHASQMSDGAVWVRFLDQSQLGLRPDAPTVTFVRPDGLSTE